jgi:hypothetical protein
VCFENRAYANLRLLRVWHVVLVHRKLRAAKRALGAATATETIERALDLAVFQRELVDGTRAMLGIEITPPDGER